MTFCSLHYPALSFEPTCYHTIFLNIILKAIDSPLSNLHAEPTSYHTIFFILILEAVNPLQAPAMDATQAS